MNLNEVFESIVNNTDIHNLLTDALAKKPLKNGPYKKLVEFQVEAYDDARLNIETQGFQIGEPWNGDMEKARILFLSSNPAFTANENFPRYFAQDKTFAMPDKKKMSLSDIREFFTGRFQNACVKNDVLHVETIGPDGKKSCQPIPYWGCIRNNVKDLISDGDGSAADVKALMSRAVSMEFVPFKSNMEAGVSDALETCWKNFTQYILAKAAASIFVLVGMKAKEAFLANALCDAEQNIAAAAFDQKEIYIYKDTRGTDRAVVWVEFNSGKFSRFETYFSKPTLGELRKRI